MTTARNLLYADLTKVLTTKSEGTVRERVLVTLEKYRIQLRPGLKVDHGLTAREALFNEIIEKCTMISAAEIPRRLDTVFDSYRMQSKGKASKKSANGTNDSVDGRSPTFQGGKLVHGVKMEPVGGGPVRRSKARGECPKCHSMGVVLAHSYSGDDYFSCIYCGFQAYGAAIETDLDLPLAAELLGRRFDEKAEIEPEELENENP